jgi:hypothetical protein
MITITISDRGSDDKTILHVRWSSPSHPSIVIYITQTAGSLLLLRVYTKKNPQLVRLVVFPSTLPFHSYHPFSSLLASVCGVLGLFLHDATANAAPEICEGLSLLQHRGQDACGIITCGPRGRLYQCKANGMVRDVFTQDAIVRLIGGMGIGHGELYLPVSHLSHKSPKSSFRLGTSYPPFPPTNNVCDPHNKRVGMLSRLCGPNAFECARSFSLPQMSSHDR